MLDLGSTAVDDFQPVVGDTFTLKAADLSLPLELIEAVLYDKSAPVRDEEGRRNAFSLTFRGPPEPVVAQRIYHLEHEGLGPIEVFMVPIGADAAKATYHVVFT